MFRQDPFGALRGAEPSSSADASPTAPPGPPSGVGASDDGWSWPPYAPVEVDDEPLDTADWAPSSVVWHPHLRVGRWTLVYRR